SCLVSPGHVITYRNCVVTHLMKLPSPKLTLSSALGAEQPVFPHLSPNRVLSHRVISGRIMSHPVVSSRGKTVRTPYGSSSPSRRKIDQNIPHVRDETCRAR